MPSVEYDATPDEIRRFAILQVALVAGFLVLLFFTLGGSDADYPPIWLAVLLVVFVGVGAFFSERVWLSAAPLPTDLPAAEMHARAVDVFAAQTVRKLYYCTGAMLPAVIAAFVGGYGGWPLVIAGFPGLLVLAWEVWPSLRNTSMTAAMLDANGAESQLVESFLTS